MKRLFRLLLLLFLCSCGPTIRLNKENISEEFGSAVLLLDVKFLVQHYTSDSSRLYYSVNKKDLLFMSDGESFQAKFRIKYEVFPNYNTTTLLDSGTVNFQTDSSNSDSFFKGDIPFKFNQGLNAVIKIQFKDLNRNNEITRLLVLRKENNFQRQNFLLLGKDGLPLFRDFISDEEQFTVSSRDTSVKSYWVRCYFKNYPMALPPFKLNSEQVFNYRADSIFNVDANEISALRLHRYGFYFFQPDSSLKEGVTVYRFEPDFPEIKLAEQLVNPTRYLTTKDEFQEIYSAKDKRNAIDRFWLNLGGSKDRARTLIREYYNRVEESNRYFTSYTEGWKTDRGMIYIIFGSPQSVYREDQAETWIYKPGVSLPDISFTFKKIKNPFSESDYSLIRQAESENYWYRTVEQWRSGRVANEY